MKFKKQNNNYWIPESHSNICFLIDCMLGLAEKRTFLNNKTKQGVIKPHTLPKIFVHPFSR